MSSAGLSSRQQTPRGPFLQLLKAMGMSSAKGRWATSLTSFPSLQAGQSSCECHHVSDVLKAAALAALPLQAQQSLLGCRHAAGILNVAALAAALPLQAVGHYLLNSVLDELPQLPTPLWLTSPAHACEGQQEMPAATLACIGPASQWARLRHHGCGPGLSQPACSLAHTKMVPLLQGLIGAPAGYLHDFAVLQPQSVHGPCSKDL